MTGEENKWIGLAINLICSWIAVDYMDKGFLPKFSGRRRGVSFACGVAAYFLLLIILNSLTSFEGILGFGYGLVLFGYGVMALKGNRREMAFFSVIWILLVFFSFYITVTAARLATGLSLAEFYQIGFYRHYYSLAAAILRLVMAKLVLAAKKGMSGASKAEELILAVAFSALFFVSAGIVLLDLEKLGHKDKNLLSLGLLFGLLGIAFSLVYFYRRLDEKNKKQLAAEYGRIQLLQQMEQLEQLNQVCSELGRFRHDLTGMLDTVSGMIQNGKQEEALGLLDRMDRRLQDSPALAKSTGNEGLDMALLRTNQSCRELGIDFHYAIGGNVSRYDSMDMGVLFYNLLKNAVEACGRLEQKENAEIFLQIWGTSDGILCRLENTVRESILESNPSLRSGKPGKLRHGFGIKSIQDIVEACRGSYRIWEEDGMFHQEIRLPDPDSYC